MFCIEIKENSEALYSMWGLCYYVLQRYEKPYTEDIVKDVAKLKELINKRIKEYKLYDSYVSADNIHEIKVFDLDKAIRKTVARLKKQYLAIGGNYVNHTSIQRFLNNEGTYKCILHPVEAKIIFNTVGYNEGKVSD